MPEAPTIGHPGDLVTSRVAGNPFLKDLLIASSSDLPWSCPFNTTSSTHWHKRKWWYLVQKREKKIMGLVKAFTFFVPAGPMGR